MSETRSMVEIDLNAAMLAQSHLELIYALCVAKRLEGTQLGDIVIKRVPLQSIPHLIVDYGQLFAAMCEVLEEYAGLKEPTFREYVERQLSNFASVAWGALMGYMLRDVMK